MSIILKQNLFIDHKLLFEPEGKKTHRQLVDGSVLIDDIEDSVVVGEEGLVVNSPLKCGVGAFKHRSRVALKHTQTYTHTQNNITRKEMPDISVH